MNDEISIYKTHSHMNEATMCTRSHTDEATVYKSRREYELSGPIRIKPSGSEVEWDASTDNHTGLFTETRTLLQINTVGALVLYGGRFMQILHVLDDSSVLCAVMLEDTTKVTYRYKKEIEVQTPPELLIRRSCKKAVRGWSDRVSGGYCLR